jgi:hypothetical protein
VAVAAAAWTARRKAAVLLQARKSPELVAGVVALRAEGAPRGRRSPRRRACRSPAQGGWCVHQKPARRLKRKTRLLSGRHRRRRAGGAPASPLTRKLLLPRSVITRRAAGRNQRLGARLRETAHDPWRSFEVSVGAAEVDDARKPGGADYGVRAFGNARSHNPVSTTNFREPRKFGYECRRRGYGRRSKRCSGTAPGCRGTRPWRSFFGISKLILTIFLRLVSRCAGYGQEAVLSARGVHVMPDDLSAVVDANSICLRRTGHVDGGKFAVTVDGAM